MINLIICDDQEVVCQGLQAILSTTEAINVLGIANNGVELIEKIEKKAPHVVLMDLKMPVMNGLQATKEIKQKYPQIKVLVLTTYDADAWVFDAIRNGADGYLLKDASREKLIQAIVDVSEDRTPVDEKVAVKLFTKIAKGVQKGETLVGKNLTDREKEILGLIANGLSNAEIAQEIFLSKGTVRNYVSAILEKLEVKDRTQAAVVALRYGIVD
ncbi:MAG TPA: response regulator transcription factor [Anaerolineae bacterium]|nr:response regulator transcription factor [Anaerolineae bacterium]